MRLLSAASSTEVLIVDVSSAMNAPEPECHGCDSEISRWHHRMANDIDAHFHNYFGKGKSHSWSLQNRVIRMDWNNTFMFDTHISLSFTTNGIRCDSEQLKFHGAFAKLKLVKTTCKIPINFPLAENICRENRLKTAATAMLTDPAKINRNTRASSCRQHKFPINLFPTAFQRNNYYHYQQLESKLKIQQINCCLKCILITIILLALAPRTLSSITVRRSRHASRN